MAAGVRLHCLPISHKKDIRLIWVKFFLLSILIGCFTQVLL